MNKSQKQDELWCHYSDMPSPSAYQQCMDYDSMGNHGRFPMKKNRQIKKNLLTLLFEKFKRKNGKNNN